MKTNEQVYAESREYLQRKLDKLAEDRLFLDEQIRNTEELLKEMARIYESDLSSTFR